MAKNEQEIKKEIKVENKRASDNSNQVTLGFSKIVGLKEFLKLIEILLMLFWIVIVNCCIMRATCETVFCLTLPSLNKVDTHTYIESNIVPARLSTVH